MTFAQHAGHPTADHSGHPAGHHHHRGADGGRPAAAPSAPAHPDRASLNAIAWAATLHCLAGCAIGEVAGLVIGTALGWSNGATIALAVALAFVSGFALTLIPLLRRGYAFGAALRTALAADTASITIMEIVDNTVMLVIPGAMDAPLHSLHFWGSMVFALAVAGLAAFPVNRWLIARGAGHAHVHAGH